MSELEFWKDLGNIFDAVMSYQKKNVEFNSRFINPWIRLGNIFERQDQANDAIQAYQHATEIDPDTAQNWVDLGDAHFKKGGFGEATEAYRKAVVLDPEAGWPLGNLALSMVTQGNIEEAIPLYKKSIDLLTEVKDKAVCWNRLGNAYRKLNDYENAFHAFQKADQLDGDNTGFSDKLDETPPSMPVVSSEEIIEQIQMVVSPDLEENITGPTACESVEERAQPEFETASVSVLPVETADEVISVISDVEVIAEAIGPEEVVPSLTETCVEEPENAISMSAVEESQAISEEKFDLIQVVEDVIAKVEQEYADQNNSIAIEGQQAEEIPVEENNNTTSIIEEVTLESELIITEVNIEVMPEADAPVINEEVVPEVETPVLIEEVVAITETPLVSDEAALEVEPAGIELPAETKSEIAAPVANDGSEEQQVGKDVTRRAPAWLVIKDAAVSEEKAPVTEAEVQQDLIQVESVTTLSEISQEAAISESAVNMDIVETYTNPLEAQLTAEPSLSDELLHGETTAQVDEGDSELQPVTEVQEISDVAETNSVEEAAVSEESSKVVAEEQAAELAYEEYLKDVAEPVNPLTDHVKELQSESPLTKISKNGDVRLAMDTKNANVWNELGNIYLNAGTCDEAIAAYSKAIEIDRRFAWPYSNLALAYVQKGRFTEAILLYQRGIELFTSDRDKAITWNRLGNVYRRINDYKHAIESYQTADELDPENATLSLRSSFGLLGNMYSDSKPALVE
jgi:tetratricopeptide (TPR) repeat protein